MITPLNLPFNPDLLPGDQLVSEDLLHHVRKHFGASVKLVATRSLHESIPRSLRAEDVPGSNVPALHQPMVVGIVVGAESGKLVAAGFHRKEDVANFMKANAPLKDVLVTVWNGHYLLWMRTDFLGRNLELPEMLWITHGVVPIAWLDKRNDAIHVHQPGILQQADYNTIVWPTGVDGIFKSELLRELYGPPYLRKGRTWRLNLNFWAPWCLDRLRLIFDPRIASFLCSTGSGGETTIVGMATAEALVTDFVQKCAAMDAKTFPLAEIRPSRIHELVELMQKLSSVHLVGEAPGLNEFLSKGLRKKIGATITSAELWHAYLGYFQCRGEVTLYPECEFKRISPVRIREMFRKTKVNSIERAGKARKGYNDLCLATTAAELKARANNDNAHTGVEGQTGASAVDPAGDPPVLQSSRGGPGCTDRSADTRDAEDAKDGNIGRCPGEYGTCLADYLAQTGQKI